ncbi:TnpV protein [Lachnospira hominis (ex Liu et al. 2021)]|uniref:TnpV protein n=1 Tax=Lachnospira hominis (ex Liu et al. 2021) TaxID=2763051 RepID=A0ABR7G003_9FIRM|nr:TnpV protein [Lachnospira hominis]MBC5680767.1 TnpV protein [Lachnospira hominis]
MKTELKNIGTWGRLHYDFLYRNNRTVINVMRLNGTLNNYLAMHSEQSEKQA